MCCGGEDAVFCGFSVALPLRLASLMILIEHIILLVYAEWTHRLALWYTKTSF